MPLLLLIMMAFWGAGVSAEQSETDYSIVISPPARLIRNSPSLIDSRYFSGRFIFYFNDRTEGAEWNGDKANLAALEEGSAVVVFAGPETRKYPLKNTLKIKGRKGKTRTYSVSFVPQYVPRRGAAIAVVREPPPVVRDISSSDGSSALTLHPQRSPMRLGSFQAMAFISVPKDGNTAFSPLVAWTPQWHFSPEFTFALSIGFSPMKTMSRGFFVATEYAAEVGLRREHWQGYGGAGVQVWHQRLGVNPLGTLGVRYYHARLRDSSQAWLMAGYSAYLPQGEWVHQLRFGLGFEI